MRNKQEILDEIQAGLSSGLLTEADIKSFVSTPPVHATIQPTNEPEENSEKLSAVDVMFYVAGIVLYGAISSFIVQSWNDVNPIIHIILSAGIGAILWTIVYKLLQSPAQSDIKRGLVNSMILTGALSIIEGGYIITNTLIGGFGEVNFIAGAFTLAVLGAVHIGFYQIVNKNILLLIGILLSVLTFPALLFGFLEGSSFPIDIWSVIFIMTALLLVFATRVAARLNSDQSGISRAFDAFAAFVALAIMYGSSYTEYGIIWLIALVFGILGLFYLSIVSQNRHLLGNASFFLVLTIITISFRYFSGYGITTSLVVAALGILGTAAVASSINKKYFNQPSHIVQQ